MVRVVSVSTKSKTSLEENIENIASASAEIRKMIRGEPDIEWGRMASVSAVFRAIIGSNRAVFVREYRMGPYCDRDILEEACQLPEQGLTAARIFNTLDQAARVMKKRPDQESDFVPDPVTFGRIANLLDRICQRFTATETGLAAE